MVSHGWFQAPLCPLRRVVYDRIHSRGDRDLWRVGQPDAGLSVVFLVFTFVDISCLPVNLGFIGEFLRLLGPFRVNVVVATLATPGRHLSALLTRSALPPVIFGKLKSGLAHITEWLARTAIFVPGWF